MISLEHGMLIRAIKKKKLVSKELKTYQIQDSLNFQALSLHIMNWVDPKIWDGKKTYGTEQITTLITHFEVPLKVAGFHSKAIFKEWDSLKFR